MRLKHIISFLSLIFILFISLDCINLEAKTEKKSEDQVLLSLAKQVIHLLVRKDYKNAEEKAHEFLIIKPNSADGYMLLARIYYRKGANEKYKKMLSKIRKINPEKASSLINALEGSIEHTIQLLELEHSTKDLDSEEYKFRQGIISYLKAYSGDIEKYDEAIKEFKEVIKMNGNNAKAYYYLGTCYREKYGLETSKKKKDQYLSLAQINFIKAARIDPKYIDRVIILGYYYSINMMSKKLDVLCNDLLQIDPKNEEALKWQEELRIRKNNLENEKQWQKILETKLLSPKEIQKEAEEKQKEIEGLEFYRLVEDKYKRNPSDPKVAFELGIAYWEKVKEGHKEFFRKTEAMLKKAIELDPDFALAQYQLRKYYLETGQKEKAEQYSDFNANKILLMEKKNKETIK